MNIRRFVAADMRGALAAIRAELGADAVMLSSRRMAEGVEVIAAIDYDDSLIATFGGRTARDVEEPRSAGARAGYAAADETDSDDDDHGHGHGSGADDGDGDGDLSEYQRLAKAFAHAKEPAWQTAAANVANVADVADVVDGHVPPRAAAAAGPDTRNAAAHTAGKLAAAASSIAALPAEDGVVVEELKDLRRLLETQLASLAWNEVQRRTPVRARMLRELAKLGVDAKLAAELADEVPVTLDSQQALRRVMRLLGERVPLVQEDMAETGGVFALVGPTGVGKTTTIAKIAARAVLKHGVDSVGLISTDTYRVGARQQLSNFARILRAPLHVAENALELGRLLDGFAKKKLVLIDTAGMSQRDVRLASQFATLKVEGHRIRTVLVLSAAADRGCLTQALGVFKQAAPESLIVTKLDEATALGGVLSLALASALPIAYLADGQRVPEDLHLAAPKRFWLLHNAVSLTLDPLSGPGENELAQAFGHMELAANA
jgi:flagellar biosynthesis protein FlhF